jgi:hypothetical protein
MVKRRGPPGQGWRTFLRNHAPNIAAMDLFIVPTVGFDLLYAFVIVGLSRRNLVWINVTTNPTAEWIARQITEAFPWNEGPRYLVRDRDQIFGAVVMRRIRAMGIRDEPIAPVSPWQNGPLGWCGMWVGWLCSLLLVPLFGWACVRAAQRSQPLFCFMRRLQL